MKIRIVSEGHGTTTKVLDENGEVLENITGIEIKPIEAGKSIQVVLTIDGVELDIAADIEGAT